MNKNIQQYNHNGQRHGYWEIYLGNGNDLLFFKCYYHNDIPHGYWEHYWNYDGNITHKVFNII